MNDFDKYFKNKAAEEQTDIPSGIRNKIEETLDNLPEKPVNNKKKKSADNKKIRILPRITATAACFVFIALFLLPNVSVIYAKAIEKVPLIGDIVRVITVRNYFYSDENHEMDIDVPKVENENSEAADYINKNVDELTSELVAKFYEDLEITGNNGHGSIYVDYETVTNNNKWFTLKIKVYEVAGSSNTYYKYYHINKQTGKTVKLGDMVINNQAYDVLNNEIQRQMRKAMAEDSNIIYWIEDSIIGTDIVAVTPDHNFYWNENGELVISFNKYEVAPGSMGTPEFVIKNDILDKTLKKEFRNLISEN